MKKSPYGISNYEELIEDDYYYVDKTKYIENLENLAEKRIMFLRPRKFGKTLFTSTLENYYDIKKADKFEKLYGETYIGKNPTKLKNSYHILRFNFSGIDTKDYDTTINGFKEKVMSAIRLFCENYGLDFYVNENSEAENILDNLFKAFYIQKSGGKIYVIIDEYDHFANELLGFNTDNFKELVSRNGKVRKWYEILKQGTETVVDRIFITGVAPITLDSLTSGFNIGKDITRDIRFNEMLGFTKEELIKMMTDFEINEENQEELLPILKENYDGYKFCTDIAQRVYNSNMCLYLLNEYVVFKKVPNELIDVNIASDYKKLSNMLELCSGEERKQILETAISGDSIIAELVSRFNPEKEFEKEEFISLLFYLGYLTIVDEEAGYPKLGIPNKIMKELYSQYFLKIVTESIDVEPTINFAQIGRDLAIEGKIDRIVDIIHLYLNNLSNRDYQNFDEKYVKLIFYCIVMNLKEYTIKSEVEINRNYPDLLIVPRNRTKGYKSVMIEFKYLKKEDSKKLKDKQLEAREQIKKYGEFEDIKDIDGLKKYTVVVINDEIYVEEV